MKMYLCVLIILALVSTGFAQTNVKTIISSFLRDCYSESYLLDRNNLPPMSLNVLLDLIRKVEDREVGDMRQFSAAISHTFRQDGIVYDPAATGAQNIVPFRPSGFPAYKNRLLLNKLVPNSLIKLDDEILVSEDKCALHHMVSSTVALHYRGDEQWTCGRIFTGTNSHLRVAQYRKSHDIELFDVNAPINIIARQITGVSSCPIETGVISTPWGEVSMGTIITGIAAGLEEQRVLVTDLVTVRPGFNNNTLVVNNRYAATLSGDLAEAAIRQGVSRTTFTVGAPGGWNSTTARRHYFLNRNENFELTDAEIRGGLDGLVLSELAQSYVNRFPEFKLSQYIDMYFSHNGILHERRFRACNRIVLVPDIASTKMLLNETLGPAVALYHSSSLAGSTTLRGIENFVNETIAELHRYLPTNINDTLCQLNPEQVMRPKVNLILITEPTFARRQLISHIVDEIEVNKFGSSIMLINAANGEIVVNRTFSISTFYEQLAKRTRAQTGSFNMLNSLHGLINTVVLDLHEESRMRYSGGNATVVLFVSETIPLTGDERIQAVHRTRRLQRIAPDLRMLFATSSANEAALTPLLRNLEDFMPVSLPSLSPNFAQAQELKPVIDAIIRTPRRIVNPDCGPEMTANEESGVVTFDGFVDANGINFYRIVPNYFFGSSTTRLLRVQSFEHGPITVCYSRSNENPRRNQTNGVIADDVLCESASEPDFVEILLDDACYGYASVNSCPPLYLSVVPTIMPAEPQCREFGCRYPNDIKYLVAAHDLGCYNNVINIYGFFNTVYLTIAIILLYQFIY